MPSRDLDFSVFDADNHMYEKPELSPTKGLIELLGAERVLFGSDYPHPEGMADPITFVDDLQGLPEEDIRKVMGGNLNRLLGFDQVRIAA
jgi:predicted TIM-barrel fold metal-dependent hydrolase